jgi:outer membrane lipoprotein-sorting protein
VKRPRPCGSLRLLVVLLLILSAGCARLLPPPRQPIGEEARRALSRLVERWHAFADLRALAEVRVARGDDRRLLQGVLLARAPASLRFEALSPLGSPLLIVVIHEERLTAYNAATNEALIGEATAAAAARNLSFPVDPDDLVGILVGRPVPPKDVRVAEIMPPDEHGPSLGLSGADWHQRLWMDFTTGVVHRVELTGGRYEVLVTYQRDGDGQLTGLDFTAAQSLLTGSVRYQQAVFGGGIEPDRFRLVIPAGAKVEELVN